MAEIEKNPQTVKTSPNVTTGPIDSDTGEKDVSEKRIKAERDAQARLTGIVDVPVIEDEADQPASFTATFHDRTNTVPGGKAWIGRNLVNAEGKIIGRASEKLAKSK